MDFISWRMRLVVLGLVGLLGLVIIGVSFALVTTPPPAPPTTATAAAAPGAAAVPVGAPDTPTETSTEGAPAANPTFTPIIPLVPTVSRATATATPALLIATQTLAPTATPLLGNATQTLAPTATSAPR